MVAGGSYGMFFRVLSVHEQIVAIPQIGLGSEMFDPQLHSLAINGHHEPRRRGSKSAKRNRSLKETCKQQCDTACCERSETTRSLSEKTSVLPYVESTK